MERREEEAELVADTNILISAICSPQGSFYKCQADKIWILHDIFP